MRFLAATALISAGLCFLLNWGAFYQFKLNIMQPEGWEILGLMVFTLGAGLYIKYYPKFHKKDK
jgi:hypothetical protein